MTEFVLSPSDNHLLLRELAHRVNNDFTSIINTISRAAARSPNPEVRAALNDATEMLHNYVEVHRALRMPNPDTQVDAAEYLHRLCAVMRRSRLERMGIGLVLNFRASGAWIRAFLVFGIDCLRTGYERSAALVRRARRGSSHLTQAH